MVNEYTTYSDEHRYTTDHEAIRNWAEARNAIPVASDEEMGGEGEDTDATTSGDNAEDAPSTIGNDRSEETGRMDYRFTRREEQEISDEEEAWNSFFEAFEDDDRAFVVHKDPDDEDGIDFHELPRREALADSDVQQLEGTQRPSRDD